ncbi:hypothetical protein [Roseivivax marinus]|nr:hypothetical protein [Roseivivax marinus]
MRMTSILAAAAAFSLSAGAAAAWDDSYRGEATNDPNSDFMIHSYPAANHCPQGLQPVVLGGVISCGTPDAGPYINRAGGHATPTRAHRSYGASGAYAVEGEKGVVYR